MLELYDSLKQKPGVILVGPAGSGKTVCRETLSRALNALHSSPPKEEEKTKQVKKIPITVSQVDILTIGQFHRAAKQRILLSNIKQTTSQNADIYQQMKNFTIIKVILLWSSSKNAESRQSFTMDKIRRTAGAVAKLSLSWVDAATQGVKEVVYPGVDADIIFPDALSVEEVSLATDRVFYFFCLSPSFALSV